MKTQILLGAVLVCAVPVWAQPDPIIKPLNGLPFPLIAPAQAQALVQQPLVFHLREVTLRAALEDLQKQSGVKINTAWAGDDGQLDKKLSLDLETSSFAQAFDDITDEAGVKASLSRFGSDSAWNLRLGQNAANDDAPRSGVGEFQVRLSGINSNFSKSVKLGKNNAPTRTQKTTLSLSLDMVPAPGLKIIGAPRFRLTRAADAQGNSLLLPARDDPFPFRFNSWSFPRAVELKVPAAPTPNLAQLEGVAVVVVPTKRETLEIPDIAASKGTAHTFGTGRGAVSLTVEEVKQTGNSLSLRLKVRALGDRDDEGLSSPLLSAELLMGALQLKTADGQILSSGGYGANGGSNELLINAQFVAPQPAGQNAAAPGPLTLLLDAPTEFAQTEVPFSFENVPLP